MLTLITWRLAVSILDDPSRGVPTLDVEAGTGLITVLVLVVVINWFFHRIYWTGWISFHSRRKHDQLQGVDDEEAGHARLRWGLGLLGFTSLYREGFEVVLFLQDFRLKLGGGEVLCGVLLGLGLTAVVAFLTFMAHRRLPYGKMLVVTGDLSGPGPAGDGWRTGARDATGPLASYDSDCLTARTGPGVDGAVVFRPLKRRPHSSWP